MRIGVRYIRFATNGLGLKGPELAAGGLDVMLESLQSCSSPRWQHMILTTDKRVASQLLGYEQCIKFHLVETLRSKLGIWKTIPFRLLGTWVHTRRRIPQSASSFPCGLCNSV